MIAPSMNKRVGNVCGLFPPIETLDNFALSLFQETPLGEGPAQWVFKTRVYSTLVVVC